MKPDKKGCIESQGMVNCSFVQKIAQPHLNTLIQPESRAQERRLRKVCSQTDAKATSKCPAHFSQVWVEQLPGPMSLIGTRYH